MLEGAVEMPPDLVRRPDYGLTHDAGLARRVQLVVLEVRVRISCLVLSFQPTDPCFFARQQGRRSGWVVVTGSFIDHEATIGSCGAMRIIRGGRRTQGVGTGAGWGERGCGAAGPVSATTGPRGSSAAAQSPRIPIPANASIAAAYAPFVRPATRIVPATAVPIDEPRLDTERESPEISPCISSLKLDCTRLTDGVSIAPRPNPVRKSPGARPHALVVALAPMRSTAMPTMVVTNPAMIRVRWARRFANRSAPRDEINMPAVAAVKMTPVWIAS